MFYLFIFKLHRPKLNFIFYFFYSDFDVHMDFDEVKLDLENFLGGGRWTEVLLKILNDLSKDLFRKCLPLLKVIRMSFTLKQKKITCC